MTIDDRVRQAVGRVRKARAADGALSSLAEFYGRMKSEGLVLNKRYDLPLVDTIGSTLRNPREAQPARKV